jgi:hypothetical protein
MMERKRIYISGPMDGVPDYAEQFAITAQMLEDLGYEVVNPAAVSGVLPPNLPWVTYIDIDLALLKACNCIYMMPAWVGSKGAVIERTYAEKLGLKIYYHNNQSEL